MRANATEVLEWLPHPFNGFQGAVADEHHRAHGAVGAYAPRSYNIEIGIFYLRKAAHGNEGYVGPAGVERFGATVRW